MASAKWKRAHPRWPVSGEFKHKRNPLTYTQKIRKAERFQAILNQSRHQNLVPVVNKHGIVKLIRKARS